MIPIIDDDPRLTIERYECSECGSWLEYDDENCWDCNAEIEWSKAPAINHKSPKDRHGYWYG